MRTYAEETKIRVSDMNRIRAYYDVSPAFEMGYIVSEILERYRKMVAQIKGPYEEHENSPGVAFATKRCEYVQKLFFEIFQLSNMVHEIERKWSTSLLREKKGLTGEDGDDIDSTENRNRIKAAIAKARHARLREIKKRKKWRKQQGKFGLIASSLNKDRRPKNKWWPLDYGWEIDYYW